MAVSAQKNLVFLKLSFNFLCCTPNIKVISVVINVALRLAKITLAKSSKCELFYYLFLHFTNDRVANFDQLNGVRFSDRDKYAHPFTCM